MSEPAAPKGHLAAIVLAAGASRRMGSDKALLEFGGEPAVGRVLRVLRAVPVQQIIVVQNLVRSAVRRAVSLEGLTSAINLNPDAGQTSSIRIGVQNLTPAAALFLLCPVDVPLFEAEDVRALVAALAADPEKVIAVPCHGGRRGHPVLCRRALAHEFRALSDGAPAHEVIRREPARVAHVEVANPEVVQDLDTPEDYAAAVRRLAGRAPAR